MFRQLVGVVVGSCLALMAGAGCDSRSGDKPRAAAPTGTLVESRKTFETTLSRHSRANKAVDAPPAKVFEAVAFPSRVGPLLGYVSIPRSPGRHAAAIWLPDRFDNSVDMRVWDEGPDGDAHGAAFRRADIVTMVPSFRGGNQNPGYREGLFGEVDDVLAAADFLASRPEVDPQRIYLAGHGVGATLALLTAECSDRFRAVFALGPVDSIVAYDEEQIPVDLSSPRETQVRSPVHWLRDIRRPTFIIEGISHGNAAAVHSLEKAADNPRLHFHFVRYFDHDSLVTPTTRLLASKITQDVEAQCNISITTTELEDARRGE